MKIRVGFVSNSSSSSFVVLGCQFDVYEWAENIINKNRIYKKYIERQEEWGEEIVPFDNFNMRKDYEEFYQAVYDIAGEYGLESYVDFENDFSMIGISPFKIGDNETGKEFTDRVKLSLEEFGLKNFSIEAIEESIDNF